MEEFLAFIRSYIALSEEAEETIRSLGKEISKKKGEFIAEEGKTAKHLYFLTSGVARTFL